MAKTPISTLSPCAASGIVDVVLEEDWALTVNFFCSGLKGTSASQEQRAIVLLCYADFFRAFRKISIKDGMREKEVEGLHREKRKLKVFINAQKKYIMSL